MRANPLADVAAAAIVLEGDRNSVKPSSAVGQVQPKLQGKLLLLHATSDDDVPFGDAMRLMSALNRANESYDVVIFPEGSHLIQGPYWWQRVTDRLVEHLRP